MTVVTPDGGIIVPHSPMRRSIARAVFGDKTHPIRGGVAKYSPRRFDLMLRDIAVAASDRIQRAIEIFEIQPEGTEADLVEVQELMNQARMVAPLGIKAGDVSEAEWMEINQKLGMAEKLQKNWQNNQDVDLLNQSVEIFEGIVTRLESKG